MMGAAIYTFLPGDHLAASEETNHRRQFVKEVASLPTRYLGDVFFM